MKKSLVIAGAIVCLTLCSCGQTTGVSQEEYDKVVAENTELKEEVEENDNKSSEKAKEYFSYDENIETLESDGGSGKTLWIIYHVSLFSDTSGISSAFSELGEKLDYAKNNEEWFDYGYVFIDAWSESVGRITSMTINIDDLSKPMQSYSWHDSDETESQAQNENANVSQSTETVLYEDDKVIISFSAITEKGVEFWVQNLTDVNITIQADSVSVNGVSTNSIVMSDDVAPQSKGKVTAKCDDFLTVEQVTTVGGQLRIIDFGKSFDTYKAVFVNIPIE